MRKSLVALLLVLGVAASSALPVLAAIENDMELGAEGLKLQNAQMVRELTSRAARLGTSAGPISDTTWVGYDQGAANYWEIYSGTGSEGFYRPYNGTKHRGIWDFEKPVKGDSLQGWWPLINLYASAGGQTRTDINRPWWALDFGNMANYVINQANGRTFGVVGVWHRDGGLNAPAPVGLMTPNFTPPSGTNAAWMGLRAHGDNTYVDGKTGNPFNEDVLMYTTFGATSSGGNDAGFPGYGSQMDQMLYRDIDFQGKKLSDLTIRFKFQTVMSEGFGNTAATRTGWFNHDPLGVNQLNNFISSSAAGDAFAPRDSFMVYIGSGVEDNDWLGSDLLLRPVYDKQRRWFGEVLHADFDPLSNPANPQPLYYRQLLGVAGNWPTQKSKTADGFVDTTFTIPNAALTALLAKDNKIRLVFRVKTNRGFDDQGTAYTSGNKGAAVVDRVSYTVGTNPEVIFGDFENVGDIDNDVNVSALDAWKSTGKPPGIYHHTHLFSDLTYQDLCGQKGDISRVCDMSGIVVSAGNHDEGEAASGQQDGTAFRERNDGIMSPTIIFADDDANPDTKNVHGLYGAGGNLKSPGSGDVDATEDIYIRYDIYTGIMDPFTKGNLWRFAFQGYPGNAKALKGSYPAWGAMRFPGFIIFNPDKQCLQDFEGAIGSGGLLKTSNPSGIPDSLRIFLGKTQQCFRFGVTAGCAPTDGCYWDNITLCLIDGNPTQVSVDIWNWINDAFPANESPGLPGTADFDTAGAHMMTGLNIAQATANNLRPNIPGDSVVVFSSPTTARLDMVFRILPGPGNYEPKGQPQVGYLTHHPQTRTLVTKGDGSFWNAYRQNPGNFASPNAIALHNVPGLGGWDPNVWSSARCDTQETNIYALQGRGVQGGPGDPTVWQNTLHESDPHYAELGIPHPKCFVTTATAALTSIVCDGSVPQYLLDIGVSPSVGTTLEGTKIIPDGLLTPGAHLEYFFRDQKDDKAKGPMDGMVPDTNLVLQGQTEGSTDGHRWQEVNVLPNAWKKANYFHPVVRTFGAGPSCLLVVDNNDRRGNERVWVSVSDTIGAVPQRWWGANNGWHAIGGNPATACTPVVGAAVDLNDPANHRIGDTIIPRIGFTAEHMGQGGSGGSWDIYNVKASESLTTSAGSLGSRLSVDKLGKRSRQGPTPAMLAAYYSMMLFLSGDLNSGILGPYKNRSQDDAGIIISWLQGGSIAAQNRAFWAIGDGFAESNIFSAKAGPTDLMLNYLGCDLLDPNWIFFSGDTRDVTGMRLLPGWQNKPAGQIELFGMRNICLWTNDVLTPGGIGLPALAAVASEYHGNGASGASGIFKDWAPGSPWKTLVDGWDIEHLTRIGDVCTLDRSGYFYKIFANVWAKLCIVNGNPIVPLDVPNFSDDEVANFVKLAGNPVRNGSARINFGLARADRVEVKVYDVTGRLVRTLADRQFPAGTHDLVWDGSDNAGRQVARGVYFTQVRYQNVKFSAAKKLTVLN